MEIEQNTTYQTTDFYLTAALISSGRRLLHLDRTNPRSIIFVFDNSDFLIGNLVNSYWDKTLSVSAKDFATTLIDLKTRIHTGT
jgi:hypothetical protein